MTHFTEVIEKQSGFRISVQISLLSSDYEDGVRYEVDVMVSDIGSVFWRRPRNKSETPTREKVKEICKKLHKQVAPQDNVCGCNIDFYKLK